MELIIIPGQYLPDDGVAVNLTILVVCNQKQGHESSSIYA
jgi:hypothetical protein